MSDSSLAMLKPQMIRQKIEAVSPTVYSKLKLWKKGNACPLQLLWSGLAPLPPSPAAKLGEVVHSVLGNASDIQSSSGASELWDRAVKEMEFQLQQHWTTTGLAPLHLTVNGYELRRQMVLRRLAKPRFRPTTCSSGPSMTKRFLREERLVSADGLVHGRIDFAEQRSDGWALTDFKSGGILDDDGSLRDSYREQLLLYAFLLKDAKGIDIRSAAIKTLDGKEYQIESDQNAANSAGDEARQLLGEFNALAAGNAGPNIARPLPSTKDSFGCTGCLFRPQCLPYKDFKKVSDAGAKWPRDAWGKIRAIQQSERHVEIEIENLNDVLTTDGKAIDRMLRLRLDNSISRHPALNRLGQGMHIEIYNYVSSRYRLITEAGPRTCLYRKDEMCDSKQCVA